MGIFFHFYFLQEEPDPAAVARLIQLSGHCYEDKQVYKMEEYVFGALK